jgi:hypothetical protein
MDGRARRVAERNGDSGRGHHADRADAHRQASNPAQPVLAGGHRETHVIPPHGRILPLAGFGMLDAELPGTGHS